MSQITLKNSGEEILGAFLATVTGFAIYEAVIWALISGAVGAAAAHFYKILIAPQVEKFIKYLKSKIYGKKNVP